MSVNTTTVMLILPAGNVDNGAGEAGAAGDVFSHTGILS